MATISIGKNAAKMPLVRLLSFACHAGFLPPLPLSGLARSHTHALSPPQVGKGLWKVTDNTAEYVPARLSCLVISDSIAFPSLLGIRDGLLTVLFASLTYRVVYNAIKTGYRLLDGGEHLPGY